MILVANQISTTSLGLFIAVLSLLVGIGVALFRLAYQAGRIAAAVEAVNERTEENTADIKLAATAAAQTRSEVALMKGQLGVVDRRA